MVIFIGHFLQKSPIFSGSFYIFLYMRNLIQCIFGTTYCWVYLLSIKVMLFDKYWTRLHICKKCVDIVIRPRMQKSHSDCPRTAWCVVNMFHKNGMGPLIMANGTIWCSILHCNSPWPYIRIKYMYSVISVKLDWLPGNSTKWTID